MSSIYGLTRDGQDRDVPCTCRPLPGGRHEGHCERSEVTVPALWGDPPDPTAARTRCGCCGRLGRHIEWCAAARARLSSRGRVVIDALLAPPAAKAARAPRRRRAVA